MKKNPLHHLIWAVIAIVAFACGSKLTSTKKSDKTTSSEESSSALSNRQSGESNSTGKAKAGINSSRQTSSDSSPSTLLSDEDLAELGREFRSAKGPIARRLVFTEMLKNLTPENALLMREHISHLPPSSSEYRDFHYAWGALAGQEVVEFGITTPGDDMGPAIAGWASANPENAIAWLKNLDMKSNPAYRELLDIPQLTVEGLTSHFSRALVNGLADSDPTIATDFVLDRFENGDKSAHQLMHTIAGAHFKTGDPTQATNWIASIPESDLKNTTMHRVAGEIANHNPQQALDWLQSTPQNESRAHGIGATLHTWAGKSPEKAANYISAMPASKDRDSATYGYATRVVHDNPTVGVEWASNIADPGARTSALVDTGRVFYRRDREAAQEWLSTSNLSQEAIQKITSEK
ncbi:MAG: hypothetical protein OSB05_10930 [Akkermansiaceae bacterium]|nr:hypothetical protein [Akkermansiaceae bacterium]